MLESANEYTNANLCVPMHAEAPVIREDFPSLSTSAHNSGLCVST